MNVSKNFFHPLLCYICKKSHIEVDLKTCSQCNMIQYCGFSHQKQHWPAHKKLCRIISKVRKSTDQNIGHKKYEALKLLCIAKLGRGMNSAELNMFSFAKVCVVCGTSNNLNICEACFSYYVCSDHAQVGKERGHDCDSLNLRLAIDLYVWQNDIPVTYVREDSDLSFLDIKSFTLNNVLNEGLDNPAVIALLSEPLSRPLSVQYALNAMGYTWKENLVIHVLGGNSFETGTVYYWHLLRRIQPIKKLHVFFIGPEATEPGPCTPEVEVTSLAMLYHETALEAPDVVCAFNSGIHEFAEGISFDTWGPSIAKILALKVPVVLTSFNVAEAVLDVARFYDVEPALRVRQFANPFAGLCPVRDPESLTVTFSNRILSVLQLNHTEKDT